VKRPGEDRLAPGADTPSGRLAPAGGPAGPRSHLLNGYQRNALGSILPIAERAVRLAAAELAAVDARHSAHDPAEAARRQEVRITLADFSHQIDALVAAYGVRTDERDFRVLLLGQLERAHQVLEDAAPARLIGYGAV
jgi:hypothetical protein